MSFAPMGRFFVVIFGTMGLALLARGAFSDSQQWADLAVWWELASPVGRFCMVVLSAAPLLFLLFLHCHLLHSPSEGNSHYVHLRDRDDLAAGILGDGLPMSVAREERGNHGCLVVVRLYGTPV